MELRQYLALFRRWALFLIGGLVIGAIGGYVISWYQTPVYQASTRILVTRAPQDKTSDMTYLTDQQLNENIKSSIANLRELTNKMNILVEQNKDDLKKISSNTVQLTDEAKDLLHANKEKITQSINELSTVLTRTDSLMVKFNNLADETTKRNNNLGKILYDENLYKNLTETLSQVKEMTKMIIEQLKGEGLNVDAKIDLF